MCQKGGFCKSWRMGNERIEVYCPQHLHWSMTSLKKRRKERNSPVDFQSKAGSPNNSGRKSSMDGRTSVASLVISGSIRLSGIITVCIPAAQDALTPFGASSNTKHCNVDGNRVIIFFKFKSWQRWDLKKLFIVGFDSNRISHNTNNLIKSSVTAQFQTCFCFLLLFHVSTPGAIKLFKWHLNALRWQVGAAVEGTGWRRWGKCREPVCLGSLPGRMNLNQVDFVLFLSKVERGP